jgi:hypothetical protein
LKNSACQLVRFPPSRSIEFKFEWGISKMFARTPKALAVAGMAAAMILAAPAYAQSNPFVPAAGASKAEVERMLNERLKVLEERLAKAEKGGSAAPAPSVPGGPVPGVPGGPAAPGGIDPMGPPTGSPMAPGAPGAPMVPGAPMAGPLEAPKGAVESARSNGVRFLGCINGQPKFVRTSGERVSFTTKEISDAVKAGFVPACR